MKLACCTGSSSPTQQESAVAPLLERCTLALMLKLPALPRQSPTFGKKTRESMEANLKLDQSRLTEILLVIGKISGILLKLDNWIKYQLTSDSGRIEPYALLKRITSLRNQLYDKYMFSMESAAQARHVVRGKKQVLRELIQKTPVPSSGMDTYIRRTLLSTSFEEPLVSPTSYAGSIDTPLSLRSKVALFASPPERSGLHPTYTRPYGTPTSTQRL